MAAYMIGSLTLHNTDWQKEYSEKMPALIHKHGGKILTRAPAQALEGEPLFPGIVVIIEFPSSQQALAWQEDPEHVPLRQLRRSGANFDSALINGL